MPQGICMEKQIAVLQKIFSDLDKTFGTNHAKIFGCLLQKTHRTASEIVEQTGVYKSIAYRILSQLVQRGYVKCAFTKPKVYYPESPAKILDRLVKERVKILESKKPELLQLLPLCSDSDKTAAEYVLRFENGQAKLIDKINNVIVKDLTEIEMIKRKLEGLAKQRVEQLVAYK